jgi:hypothetical protein
MSVLLRPRYTEAVIDFKSRVICVKIKAASVKVEWYRGVLFASIN